MWCLDDMDLISHIVLIPRNVVKGSVVGLTDISVNSVCNIFILGCAVA